jgi:hypothetical protein
LERGLSTKNVTTFPDLVQTVTLWKVTTPKLFSLSLGNYRHLFLVTSEQVMVECISTEGANFTNWSHDKK